jgi:DNA-binding GntR family transcriptional regulator
MHEKQGLASKHRIQRQSLPEAVTASLRERILNGDFKEGDQLIQDAIAAEYECSRMPVREAFRQLEAAGLIVMKVHKGAVVTSLPTEQIRELFDLRALLECDILIHSIPKMTDDDFKASQTVLTQLEDAYHSQDTGRWGALNWQFHRSLYEPAQRVQTLAVIQGVNLQTDRYIRLQLILTGDILDAELEHRELLRLCVARDVEAAVPYLRTHILTAGSNLLDALQQRRSQTASGS